MVSHQDPGEDSPFVEIANLANGLDELVRLQAVVKDELAACDATIDVICGSGDEQAGVSWHEISPMRGRDTSIIQPQASDATSEGWLPSIPSAMQQCEECEGWHPSELWLDRLNPDGWPVRT